MTALNVAAATRAKVLCPHCSCLDAPSKLSVEDGEVQLGCGRCERTFSLGALRVERSATYLQLVSPPAPASAKRTFTPNPELAEAFVVPEGHCPKCIAARGKGPSCAQCGLDFAQVRLPGLQPPVWLAERWKRAWDDWSNPALHRGMLDQATSAGSLPELARLYRLRLTWAPGDAVAEHARVEVMRRASLPLSSTLRTDGAVQRRRRWTAGLFALLAVLLGVSVWVASAPGL